MKAFALRISSTEGDLFSGEAVKLSLRSAGGDLAVMAGHVPFVSYVKPCDCHVELADGSERVGHVQSGVLTVARDKVLLLSGDFIWQKEI